MLAAEMRASEVEKRVQAAKERARATEEHSSARRAWQDGCTNRSCCELAVKRKPETR